MTKLTNDSNLSTNPKGRPRRAVLLAFGAAALFCVPALASAEPVPTGDPTPAVGGPGGGGGGYGWRGGGGKGHRGKGFHGRKQARLAKMKQALNLTDAQVAQLKAVRKALRAEMAKLRLEKTRIRAAMRVEWLKDQPDQTALRTLQAKKAAVMAKKAKVRFESRLKMSNILTPAQRLKAKQLGLMMGKGRFGHGKGRFGHGKGRFGHGKGRFGHGKGRFGHGKGRFGGPQD